MKALCALTLACASFVAQADAVSAAAHQAFSATLADIAQPSTGLSPRLNRLIGWREVGAQSAPAQKRLERLMAAYWDWSQTTSPESATFTGYPGQNGRWSDLSQEGRALAQEAERDLLAALEAIPVDELDADGQLNHDLLLFLARKAVDAQAYPAELMPVNQMFGVQSWVASVLNAQPLFSPADREAFLQRLEGLPVLMTQVRGLLQAGLEQGITPPQVTLQPVPDQFLKLVPEEADRSPLLASLSNLPASMSAHAREDFAAKARAIYQEQVRPAVLAVYVYVRDTYVPNAVKATGLGQLPQGQQWYAHAARGYTTTDLSPQDIHQIGLDEVERIRSAMQSVMREIGFKGSIQAFAAKVKQDSDWYFQSEEEYVTAYRALGKRVDPLIPKLFRSFPSLPYGIEPVPEFRAKGASTAYYIPGNAEFGRAGIFYINTLRMDASPKFEMEALLLHEAVPGHHFQIALAQEIDNVPEFRKHARFTAYTEGWGLYAESLGPELGLYTDPYYRYGALTYEMWRAIRLVVDTGMHALGWSRDKAIEFFVVNTGRDRARIEAEVDRYLVLPGQALAYKMGQLKIRELRTMAEDALGDAFDVRVFHDEVLRSGALPLSVLEARIQAWVQRSQAQEAAQP